MTSRNRRVVSLPVLAENIRKIRASVPETAKLLAVVKADGYGHGAVRTAQTALKSGADMLAVASVGEGTQLRKAGITAPVLVLSAVTADDVTEGVKSGLIQTICTPEMLMLCEAAATELSKKTEVHLKFDTGMGRIGVRNEQERDRILSMLDHCPQVSLTGAFTHFSDADGDQDGMNYTRGQFEKFAFLTTPLAGKVIRHCCNSAAIHRFPEMAMDMVRAGISIYGYPPVPNELKLAPCMNWSAKISFIKELPAGEYISYGRTYRTGGSIRAATVTCGYADGYHRLAADKAWVLVRGRRAKVIGRICMDQMMIDITGMDDVETGDEVVLIGTSGNERITAQDLADWSSTISYEILLSVGSRVERDYLDIVPE